MIRPSLFAVSLVALVAPFSAEALSPVVPPRLIRTESSPAVYYALPDGQRFAFPNERIYQSWFQDFSGVYTVSQSALAEYRLAGSVTYRAGTLIKLTTDPKVYVVGARGELRRRRLLEVCLEKRGRAKSMIFLTPFFLPIRLVLLSTTQIPHGSQRRASPQRVMGYKEI